MDVYLDKGKVFRLDSDASVSKGKWYFGVNCTECGKDIVIGESPTKGPEMPAFVGEGQLSIPCQCGADELYRGYQVKTFRANFSRSSYKDKRARPSRGPRQPYLPRYKNAKVTFGAEMLERRPAAAQIVARALAVWTYAEMESARILARLLEANTNAAASVYLTLQNARARQDVLKAAAKSVLSEQDYALLEALLLMKSNLEKERNAFAHGVFGICAKIPEGVVCCETSDYIKFNVENDLNGLTSEARQGFHKKCYVYELADLEKVAQDLEDLHQQLSFFAGYLLPSTPDFKARRYVELCAHKTVAKHIDIIKARQGLI